MSKNGYCFVGPAKVTGGIINVSTFAIVPAPAGTSSPSSVSFGGCVLQHVADPVDGTDAATKEYVDSKTINISQLGSITMTGTLNMAGLRITNLATPTDGADAVPKTYVDAFTIPYSPVVYNEQTAPASIVISKYMHYFQPSLSTTTTLSFTLPAGNLVASSAPPTVWFSNLSSKCTITITGLFIDAVGTAYSTVTLLPYQGFPFVWNGTAWQGLVAGYVPGPASPTR